MRLAQLKNFISTLKIPLNDPALLEIVFTAMSKQRKGEYAKDGDNFKRVTAEEYNTLSLYLDKTKIQDSASVRNVLRSRRLANLLINDKGDLNTFLLPKVIQHLKTHLYFLGLNRQFDAERQEQMLRVLQLLQQDPNLVKLLKLIGKPHNHHYADQIIRETLQLQENMPLTDAHARRAVLSAWLSTLKQSIGSCFATAPAILIHDEQPEQFLKDMNELLSTGRLKRTYGGIENSVPLSMSWGGGDLRRILYLVPDSDHEIWISPGIIEAFIAGSLIDRDALREERINKSKELVTAALNEVQKFPNLIVISVENLLRVIFLKHFGLSEQDITDFENRPHSMIQSSLMMQAANTRGGKGELCQQFMITLDKGYNAFKALADNALLKSWEFTLASLSEIKSGFTRWNLYSSLGLNSAEKGGIGECIFNTIKVKFDEANEKVKSTDIEYEQVYTHVKYLETRIKRASETEAQWLRAEFQSKSNEFYSLEEIRNRYNAKAARLSNLNAELMEFYDGMFPRYFQEIYDADMHDISTGPYDDSPAGFRLIYKHGRMNTSQWTRIHTVNDFVDSLVSFFVATEPELRASDAIQGLDDVISEIVTRIVNHVKTTEFLETALYRMAAAHKTSIVKDPLNHLDKVEKKPWVYTSGGTMETLISSYYKRVEQPTVNSRWIENPTELLVFLVDTLKQLPYKESEIFLKNPQKSMLMQSPTHAFLFKPGYAPFNEGWQNESFTYTWVRDRMIQPMQRFVENQVLDLEMMQTIIQILKKRIPDHIRYYFEQLFNQLYGTMSPIEFRSEIMDRISREPAFRSRGYEMLSSDEIDHVLFTHLPLFPLNDLKSRVKEILALLPEVPQDDTLDLIIHSFIETVPSAPILTAKNLQDICKSILLLSFNHTSMSYNYNQLITEAMQKLGYSYPLPIIFADTNWVKDKFAFVINPGTGDLQLWRVDLNGSTGYPMSIWDQWLNGARADVTWGVYTKLYEYIP